MVLASENGGSTDDWRTRLRTVLEGDEIPSLDLLMQIDALLAGPSRPKSNNLSQGSLF